MKRTYLLTLVALLSLVMTAGASYGQGTPTGPRIVLEEEEITLMEDGKEVKKLYVSKSSEEKKATIKEVVDKVLKKLGVASESEVNEKKLDSKYNEETQKLIRIKELDQPRMKFIDSDGNIVRELDTKSDVQREVRKSHPKLKKPHLMSEYITRYAKVSQDGKYAVLSESLSEGIVPETEQEKKAMADTDAGSIGTTTTVKYYDVKGNVLWERKTPQDFRVNRAMISNDGNVVAYIQDFNGIGERQESEPPTKLVVVNKEGKDIILYPAIHGENTISPETRIDMSPSGRYLGVVGWEENEHINFFIDSKNKTIWASDAFYSVRKLEDNGLVDVSYADVQKSGRKTINLKQYLGE